MSLHKLYLARFSELPHGQVNISGDEEVMKMLSMMVTGSILFASLVGNNTVMLESTNPDVPVDVIKDGIVKAGFTGSIQVAPVEDIQLTIMAYLTCTKCGSFLLDKKDDGLTVRYTCRGCGMVTGPYDPGYMHLDSIEGEPTEAPLTSVLICTDSEDEVCHYLRTGRTRYTTLAAGERYGMV